MYVSREGLEEGWHWDGGAFMCISIGCPRSRDQNSNFSSATYLLRRCALGLKRDSESAMPSVSGRRDVSTLQGRLSPMSSIIHREVSLE